LNIKTFALIGSNYCLMLIAVGAVFAVTRDRDNFIQFVTIHDFAY